MSENKSNIDLKTLRSAAAAQPNLTLAGYLAALDSTPISPPQVTTPTPQIKPVNQINFSSISSVNSLLYAGAFLIIAATLIFLGFNWQTYSQLVKWLLILVFNVAWIVAGVLAYRSKTFTQAGSAFLLIGSILLPVTGWSYQTLLNLPDTSWGVVGIVTAVIALSTYLWLAKLTHQRSYTWLVTGAYWSAGVSLVNALGWETTSYILVSSLIALSLKILVIITKPYQSAIKAWGLDINLADDLSVIILCLSFLVGLTQVYTLDNHFASEKVTIVLLVGCLYSLAWGLQRQTLAAYRGLLAMVWITLGQIMWAAGVTESSLRLTLLVVNALVNVGIWFILRQGKINNWQSWIWLTAFLRVAIYFWGLVGSASGEELVTHVIVSMLLAFLWRTRLPSLGKRMALLLAALAYNLLQIFEIAEFWYPLMFIAAAAIPFGLASWWCRSDAVEERQMRLTSLVTAAITVWWGIVISTGYDNQDLRTILTTWIAGYVALIIVWTYGRYQNLHRKTYLRISALLGLYVCHVLGIAHTSTHMSIDPQFWVLPIALITYVLAYFESVWGNESKSNLLAIAGPLMLIWLTAGQSLESGNVIYSVLLGGYGLVYLLLGIWRAQSKVKWIGAAGLVISVLIETAEYLLLIPRWLLVGAVGLGLISLALYLLSRKK